MIILNSILDEINLEKAFAQISFFYKKSNSFNRSIFLLKSFFNIAFKKIDSKNIQNGDYDFFLFKSLPERKDYDLIFYNVYELIEGKKIALQYKKKIGLNLPNIGKLFNILLKMRWSNYDILYWFIIIIGIVKCLEVIKILSKIKFKNLIVFADMQYIDNFLVQYYKENGVNTITLQHALYFDVHGTNSVNYVNYQNVVSDYFLAWGKHTFDLVRKYNKNVQIIICGKPVSANEIEGTESEVPSEFISVILDFDNYKDINQNLIDVALEISDKYNLYINLRFHPYSKRDYNYPGKFYINKNVFGSKFILGHTTTLLFELEAIGYKVLRINSKYLQKSVANIFNNIVDIVSIIEGKYVVNHSQYFIDSLGEQSLMKYSNFFIRS